MRVFVVLLDNFCQQLIDAPAHFAVDAFARVAGVTQTSQLVQHLHCTVRTLGFLTQKFRISCRQFVQRNLQTLHPFTDTFGKEAVFGNRTDQVLHNIERVEVFFGKSFAATVLLLQQFNQPRLQSHIGQWGIAEFTFQLTQCSKDVLAVESISRRRVRRGKHYVSVFAEQFLCSALKTQNVAGGTVETMSPADGRKERIVVDARYRRTDSFGGKRCFAHCRIHLLVGFGFHAHTRW